MAIVLQDFRDAFPEFDSSATDAQVERAIQEAETEVSATSWGGLYDRGVLYLSAHILKIRLAIESGDENLQSLLPLSVKTIGDVSYSLGSYLVNSTKALNFNLTPYGQEYFRLRKLVSRGGIAIGW